MAHLVTVHVISTDQNGNPVAGSRVSAKLNRADVDPDDGYIAPELKEAITDEDGTVDILLWPNERGSTQSMYEFAITNPDTGRVVRFYATIPDAECNLHEVANLPPYPGKSDGQLAIDAAVAAVAPAVAAKLGAESARDAAQGFASAASTSAGTASAAATAAGLAKTAAETARDAASTSAGTASAAATAAGSAKTAAEAARDAALAAQTEIESQLGDISAVLDAIIG